MTTEPRDGGQSGQSGQSGLRPEDAALIRSLSPQERRAGGVPDQDRLDRMHRAVAVARQALGGSLPEQGVRVSALGPGWSGDLDLHVTDWPASAELEALGWVPLDPLLARLGAQGRGRWALVEDAEVLAAVDLHAGPPPDPVSSVLDRVRRRGEVRAREVLELRALVRSGHRLPPDDRTVGAIARAEAALGGGELRRWTGAGRGGASAWLRPGPVRQSAARAAGRLAARAAHLRRSRRRVVVALSGVDGAGKSTVAAILAEWLARAGVPATRVWTRPGMHLAWAEGMARVMKRLLGQSEAPGVERVAAGESPRAMTSRRGALGWGWAMLVALTFLIDLRRRHAAATGVVVYDRHVLDALATLDFFYAGVDTRLHGALIRALVPRADLSVYLDVPAEVAVARKQDDAFGDLAVRGQLEAYATRRGKVGGLIVLDGTRPAVELAMEVFRELAARPGPGKVRRG